MITEPIAVTLLVVEVFDRLGIPYLIGGSLASALHGVVRTTLDTDLVADVKFEQVDSFVETLGEAFYVDAGAIRDAIARRSSFNMIHLETMFKVDVFISKGRPFERMQFERRLLQVMTDSDRSAYVSSAEDIILAKLEWYRKGGEVSERQWRDVLGVLKVQQGRLDLDYLRRWAVDLRVEELLLRALAEAEE